MYALVTAVFDVSRAFQSQKWSVEAYTAVCDIYSVVEVGLRKTFCSLSPVWYLPTVQSVEAHPLDL